MHFSPPTRKILKVAFLSILLLQILRTHDQLKVYEVEAGQTEEFFYLPKPQYIKPLLLGHEAFLADLIWIRMLGYFADDLSRGHKLKYLKDLIHLATDLDPRFEKIYIWAGAIFLYSGGYITKDKIMISNEILEKGWRFIQSDTRGWRHLPNYWLIPQMIGFNYAIELKDREKGAPFIAATARIPGSPDLYKTWAATLYQRAGRSEEGARVLEDMLAVEMLQTQMGTVKEEAVKERIRSRLIYYYSRLYGREEGERRIRWLEGQLMDLLKEWRSTYPYLSFPLFLFLKPGPNEYSDDAWDASFQYLERDRI